MHKRLMVCAAAAAFVCLGSIRPVGAVSDGNYRNANQHCSGGADGFEVDNTYQDGCHSFAVTVSDLGGHEYAGMGIQQTVDHDQGPLGPLAPVIPDGTGTNVHQPDLWYDLGQGCTRYEEDLNKPDQPPVVTSCPWMNPAAPNYYPQFANPPDPSSGIRIYVGADDNLAGGEHDASQTIGNGPSDGGGVHAVLDPRSARSWVLAIVKYHPKYILTHPLPVGDAGIGFCVDGICISAQTQRQVAYQGGDQPSPDASHDDTAPRDAAQYGPHTWDKPMPCDADSGHLSECGPGGIAYWHNQHGTVYDEPGVQIYNDPDPQGDSGDGVYPHPGIYIGTCGVVVGGTPQAGSLQYPSMPPSPITNGQGQLVLTTGCSGDSDVGGSRLPTVPKHSKPVRMTTLTSPVPQQAFSRPAGTATTGERTRAAAGVGQPQLAARSTASHSPFGGGTGTNLALAAMAAALSAAATVALIRRRHRTALN